MPALPTFPTSGRCKASNNRATGENFDRAATAGELAERSTTYYWYDSTDEYGKTYLRIGEDRDDREYWSYFSRAR